jgi:hypothetical protein
VLPGFITLQSPLISHKIWQSLTNYSIDFDRIVLTMTNNYSIPPNFICPITCDIMKTPVLLVEDVSQNLLNTSCTFNSNKSMLFFEIVN